MTLQCLSCGGTYADVTPDGYQYFHTCPPLSLAELQAAVDTQRVVLPPGETVEIAHGTRVYLRASARNENAAPRTGDPRAPRIIAPGKGVLEIPAPVRGDTPVTVPD